MIDRRRFVLQALSLPLALRGPETSSADQVTLFLSGDVMTGRGIDQILLNPSDPRLFEPYVRSATGYVQLAEQRHGPLPRQVDPAYVWGDLLAELSRVGPHARIVNLETSVTTADNPWPGKGIHYRMHPRNVPCLKAAGIDCCVLANNHVLDLGRDGLTETLGSLRGSGIATAGAGRDLREAQAPAVLNAAAANARVLVFGFGATNSGIPVEWAATDRLAGVNVLPDFSPGTLRSIAGQLSGAKRAGDIVVASIHWGGNWGYEIPAEQRAFALSLIEAGVDVVHGHSSHHAKGIEVYRGRLILYGCGDFLNDYEGISGHEQFRGDLALAYFPTFDPSDGALLSLEMTPFQIRRFRLNRAPARDAEWLRRTLSRESEPLGSAVESRSGGTLVLRWA